MPLQGWRIEIKAYPKLTEFGSWRGRDPEHMYGGFYTQEQVRTVSWIPVHTLRALVPLHMLQSLFQAHAGHSLCEILDPHVQAGALQVKDIVEYAARRFITVVPEIELPGHCGAALACYPHLSCKLPAPACHKLCMTGPHTSP